MNRLALLLTKLICISTLINAQNADSIKSKTILNQAYKYYSEKDFEKCRDYSLKVLDIDSTYGDAYILIGSAYVSSVESCGEDYFSKHMVYCLAVDKFQKAMELDKTVIEKAKKMIDVYSKYFPSKEAVFIEPVEGEKYHVKCWINEETTVRFSD